MPIHPPYHPIEPPNKVAIVRGLCSLVEKLPPDMNTQRSCLVQALACLEADPPNVKAALDELCRGYAHAFRNLHREARPEVWLVAAAVELLR